MSKVRALVLTGNGLNCDHETAEAFRLAGAEAQRVHINSLISGEVSLDDFQIMTFIGGFSWADDHGAGVIQAVRMKTHLGEKIVDFIRKEKLVLGICNGFQTLVNIGLLPGFDGNYSDRSVALTYNDCGRFRNDWVKLAIDPNSPCVFTKGLDYLELPIRHGEGKFYATGQILKRLEETGAVVMKYAFSHHEAAQGRFPFNPNGSLQDIAGICDPTGRVFGLMPHPEAYIHPTNYPDWTRLQQRHNRSGSKQSRSARPKFGLEIFKNAVGFFTGK